MALVIVATSYGLVLIMSVLTCLWVPLSVVDRKLLGWRNSRHLQYRAHKYPPTHVAGLSWGSKSKVQEMDCPDHRISGVITISTITYSQAMWVTPPSVVGD